MEAEKALESNISTEIGTKNVNPQEISDDIWCLKGDEFLIDDFFDIPNEEICNNNNENIIINNNNENENENGGYFLDEEYYEEEECNNYYGVSRDPVDDSDKFSTHLAIPEDDMQELELWSQLMDDSAPEPSLTYPKPSTDVQCKETGFTVVSRVEPRTKPRFGRALFFPMAVPVKPRSKRSRSARNRSWYTGSPPKSESSSSSSPSSPVSTLWFAPLAHEMGMFYAKGKPPAKKSKKKPTLSTNGETGLNSSVQRRCSHCQVTKTPQWRAGPNGPKTLCNACGVRFKSGRLFPEYRPACSPTFSSEVHSNSHRKVLEMRRNKEMTEPSSGSA